MVMPFKAQMEWALKEDNGTDLNTLGLRSLWDVQVVCWLFGFEVQNGFRLKIRHGAH